MQDPHESRVDDESELTPHGLSQYHCKRQDVQHIFLETPEKVMRKAEGGCETLEGQACWGRHRRGWGKGRAQTMGKAHTLLHQNFR